MSKDQIEIITLFFEQIKESGEITLHHIRSMLEIALDGVESKKDLSDSEKQDIKSIRELIKGL